MRGGDVLSTNKATFHVAGKQGDGDDARNPARIPMSRRYTS